MALDDSKFLAIAFEEAKAGYDEGGIPVCAAMELIPGLLDLWRAWFVLLTFGESQIGAVLVSKDGKVLGRGRNKRVQEGNNILHVG